ncbi:MAG: molybdenum ABC transporter ATP-binding protein [Hyphomicrobiaceae bacterium]
MSAAPADTISMDLAGTLGTFRLDARFELPARGVTAIFGPSGCGKTTVLRALAGLTRIPGRVAVAGEIWQDTARGVFVPPHRRHVGYVFQEASLFAHLSVRDNLLYGARRVASSVLADPALQEIAELLGIAHLLDRATTALSGGERQRVAVGRALLSSPRILLMDEPLSALDQATKEDILPYFEMLHAHFAVPIIYVSHDAAEVERLAERLVLMRAGEVLAAGPLAELQTDPALPMLTAPEATVVIEGTVAAHDRHFMLTDVDVAGGRLVVPGLRGTLGSRRRLRIAASDVSLARSAATDTTIANVLAARIVAVEGDPAEPQVSIILALGRDGGGCRIVARITRRSLSALALAPGDAVYAQVKSVALVATRA